MRGNPKFKYRDIVKFKLEDKEYTGEIWIVDKYGTWDNPSDVSYDILVHNAKHKATRKNFETGESEVIETVGDCLYKHITEKLVIELVKEA